MTIEHDAPRVLVVDDDEDTRSLLRIHLELEGFEVIGCVARAEEALARLRKGSVDIVVLDLALAGVEGLEVAPAIQAVDPDLPIVIFSAFLHPSVIARAERIGVRACIDKSQIAQLSAALREHARSSLPG